MLQKSPKKRGELATACCNIPILPRTKELLQKFQAGKEGQIEAHIVEEHLRGSTNPKDPENHNRPKAGISWNRQRMENCHFQNFCSQILLEKLIKVLTLAGAVSDVGSV